MRLSAPLAWFCVIVAALMILLGLFTLVFNTRHVGAWLPLLAIMWWPLYLGVYSVRHPRSNDSAPDLTTQVNRAAR